MPVSIRKLTSRIGAVVEGVDLTAPPQPRTVTALRDALNEHKAIVFADASPLDNAGQEQVASWFGELTTAHPNVPAADGSTHPVSGVPRAVAQVFLLPVGKGPGQLAVVNLAGAFADGHPSGIETEALTVESICGTLHANLPQITEVRFLVDGASRSTLAGHADLTRTYLTTEAVATTTAETGATP